MRKTKYIIKKIFKLFLIVFITILIYSFYINLKTPITLADNREKNTDSNNNSISDILENNFNSVVGISKLKNNGSSVFLMNIENELGLGTGIIVSQKGYILTNAHVSGKTSCYVTIPGIGTEKAKVVWEDENLDLSIIKVNKNFSTCAELGDSNNLKIGENTYAIGNPIGYEFQRTVTGGIISALNRTIKLEENEEYIYMSNLIQTDATINPGNSGGPLINENGKVIGINSVKITSADGIGFAIPINIVKPIIDKLNSLGRFSEAYLGIFAYDSSIIPYIHGNVQKEKGVYIEKIDKKGSANNTELEVGDIIIKIDEKEINKMSDLQEYIYRKNPGDNVEVTVVRNNKEIKMNIELIKK